MREFLKTFIVFVCFFLALFVQPSNIYACENFTGNIQYYSSSSGTETSLINKKEKNYIILPNRNRIEITNPQNKNNDFYLTKFENNKFVYNIFNNFITRKPIYNNYVSYNIASHLENTIYTRAP